MQIKASDSLLNCLIDCNIACSIGLVLQEHLDLEKIHIFLLVCFCKLIVTHLL